MLSNKEVREIIRKCGYKFAGAYPSQVDTFDKTVGNVTFRILLPLGSKYNGCFGMELKAQLGDGKPTVHALDDRMILSCDESISVAEQILVKWLRATLQDLVSSLPATD